MTFQQISGIVLIIIAVVMLFLGIRLSLLPPALTGVGFIFIAIVFLQKKKDNT